MGGVGSDPNYNPNGGGYGANDFDVGAISTGLMSGLGSAFGALSTAASSVTAAVQDENTQRQLAGYGSSVASTAGSFWGGLSSGATSFVNNVTQPDDPGADGLADLQRQMHSQRRANPNSKYSGFGSDSAKGGMGAMGSVPAMAAAPIAAPTMPTSTFGEAPPGPGEDPNGIERLSGESDEQYVMRQTRLRDEAKARMAAKFGGGGMGGVGSGSMGGVGNAPASGGIRAPSSGGLNMGMMNQNSSMSAPSSGNLNTNPVRRPAAPSSGNVKVASGGDFFANFGT